jgi:hypothetical protein
MFRTVSMQAGYHLTVYPVSFSLLISTCQASIMVQFMFSTCVDGKIHTILQDLHYRLWWWTRWMNACRILSSLLHIYPFYNGNEHVGDSLMALYLAHGNYPPCFSATWSKRICKRIVSGSDRKEYNPIISYGDRNHQWYFRGYPFKINLNNCDMYMYDMRVEYWIIKYVYRCMLSCQLLFLANSKINAYLIVSIKFHVLYTHFHSHKKMNHTKVIKLWSG